MLEPKKSIKQIITMWAQQQIRRSMKKNFSIKKSFGVTQSGKKKIKKEHQRNWKEFLRFKTLNEQVV